MTTITIRASALALSLALLGAASSAGAAAYIKFDGIDGESRDRAHSDWIELDSVSQVPLRPDPSGVGGPGCLAPEPGAGELVVTKGLDASTPALHEALCAGTVFPEVKLHLHVSGDDKKGKGKRVEYYSYELRNARVVSYSVGGRGGGAIALETVSLAHEGLQLTLESGPER